MAYGSSLFTGRPEEIRQLPTKTPQQLGWANQSGQQASQGLANTNLAFSPIRQEIMKQFETQTIPGLLERLQYSQGSGRLGGSDLEASLGGALKNLGGQLGAQESQYNLSKHGALLNQLGMGLQPQFETAISPETGGIWGQSAQGFGQALPLMALLSMYGQGGQGGQSQSPSGTSATATGTQQGGWQSYIPMLLKALGAGAVGFAGGGPIGGAIGAGSQLLGGR